MAEILIYAKNHWMDSLSQAEVDAMDSKTKSAYDARYQHGDIVDVFEDGRLGDHAHANHSFILVRIPLLDYQEAKDYLAGLTNTVNGEMVTLKKRKFNVPKNWVLNKIANNEWVVNLNSLALKNGFINQIETKNG